jgi:hypothetical protein
MLNPFKLKGKPTQPEPQGESLRSLILQLDSKKPFELPGEETLPSGNLSAPELDEAFSQYIKALALVDSITAQAELIEPKLHHRIAKYLERRQRRIFDGELYNGQKIERMCDFCGKIKAESFSYSFSNAGGNLRICAACIVEREQNS